MDKFYISFALFFLVLLARPQQSLIDNNPWVLQNFIINQVEIPGQELSELIFSEYEVFLLHSGCDQVFSNIVYQDQSLFELSYDTTFGACPNPAEIFEVHKNFYFDENQIARNPFLYEISSISDWEILTITNNQNNKAIYLSVWFNTQFPNFQDVFIYPNPAQHNIRLHGFEINFIKSITIFDATGKELYEKLNVSNDGNINIADLTAGLYFLKILTVDGSSILKKLVKN